MNNEISSIDDNKWRNARERFNEVKYLYNLPHRTADDVKKVATKLKLSVAQVYNLLKKYQTNPTTSAFIPGKRGWQKGHTRLLPRQITIIDEVINDDIYKQEPPKLSDLKLEVDRRCRLKSVVKPSSKAVRNRISLLDKKKLVSKQKGAQKAHQLYDPVRSALKVERPLQLVQIDHTPVDLIITDNERREAICRPWLTLAIDVYTRLILAFYLSLYRPSTVSVAAAMSQMFLPKADWLAARNIGIDWPARGIPEAIAMDNAKEFWCKAIRRACGEYGIEPIYRPVGRPKVLGAHIERLIGTVMGAVHLLPGTTFSNIAQKGKYDSVAKATLTFEEAEHWIALEILGKYHYDKHSGINLSPIGAWHNDFDKSIDFHLEKLDPQKLFVDFLPEVTRTVTREGIVFQKIHYWDDVLTAWLIKQNRKVITKYNPRDLSKIFIKDGNGHINPLGYRDLRHPPVTLSEVKYANSVLNARAAQSVNEDIIFATVLEQRDLVEKALRDKRSARRKRKERELGFSESQYHTNNNHDKTSTENQDNTNSGESWDDPDEDYTSEEWP